MRTLTDKQEAFAQAVADIANPKSLADAYRLVYKTDEMKIETVQKQASETAAKPLVAARIAELRQKREDEWLFKQVDVLREWMTIATADPGKLTKTRQFCCRHCYGEGHAYQWRSEMEFAKTCDSVIEHNAMRRPGKPARELPDPSGGFGYDRNLAPVASCPECNGDGYVDTWIVPTDQLGPAERKLFAGVKQTRDGLQVLMRDQDGALANIARFLGMFVDKREISGPNGGPIPSAGIVLTAEVPVDEATKLYQGVMG